MKRLIILIMILCSINIVKAEELEFKQLPNYVKIYKNGVENIVKIYKIYEKNTNNYVFNIDPDYYKLGISYEKSNELNANNYGRYYSKLNLFNTIVSFGFNESKTERKYFFTQMMIWNLISGYDVTIVDETGQEMIAYTNEYKSYWSRVINYHDYNIFNDKEYTISVGDTLELKYGLYKPILDNPIIDGLNFKNVDDKLYINATTAGNYQINLTKNNEQINYVYKNDNSYYWQNLGGPGNLESSFKLNVKGVNLTINEKLIDINGKFGDALLINSKYELYDENNKVIVIDNLVKNNLTPNKTYKLKDVSNNIGVNNINEIEIKLLEDNYILDIEKNIISKNITINILDEFQYDIYLKSNNELYAKIDAKTDLIKLPYGIYYIKSNDNDYYQEIKVMDNKEEILEINNSIKDDIIEDKNETIIVKDDENKENEKVDDNYEEIINKENNNEILEEETTKEIILEENMVHENFNENEIKNPKTIDNINFYFELLLISIFIILVLWFGVKSEN